MKKTIQKPENWPDFETLCKQLWGEIWDIPMKIKKNGRNGQPQVGVDVFEAEMNLQYKLAIGYFNAAIAIDSFYADSYYHRGICYAYLIKPNKAIENYSTAIKLQPHFLAAYQERARVYYAVGEYNLGIKDITFALHLKNIIKH
jgi:tetratricopeptide (TPR) repeat protein